MPTPTVHSFAVRSDGSPAVPPVSYHALADMARREAETPLPGATNAARRLVNNILDWLKANRLGDFGYEDLSRRIDPSAPGVGWGVVFHQSVAGQVREEVERLVDYRGGYPLEDWGRGDTLLSWLEKHGVDALNRDVTNKLPYYILIVGRPDGIPFHDQLELSRLRAVGRLDLGLDPQAYRSYVDSLIGRECPAIPGSRILLAASDPGGSEAARLGNIILIPSLANSFKENQPLGQDGQVTVIQSATPASLKSAMLPGEDGRSPVMACIAFPGLTFPINHRQQLAEQGALIGSAWSGGAIPKEACLAGDDVGPGFFTPGSILFSLASYGAGVPQKSEFAKYYNAYHTGKKIEEDLVQAPFTAALPRRLLSYQHDGSPACALAYAGFAGLSWISSIEDPEIARVEGRWAEEFFLSILKGETVGMACAHITGTIQSYNHALESYKDKLGRLKMEYAETIGALWIARSHARGFVILGDPAVRIHNG